MSEQRIYRASERGEYDPGPCPKCGGTDVNVDVDPRSAGVPEPGVPESSAG